jgi:hypothetical protein
MGEDKAKSRPAMVIGCTAFWGAVMVGFGTFVSFHIAKPEIGRGEASEGWPSVAGRVVHSDVARERRSDGTRYWPDVRYEYEVDGRRYTSRQLTAWERRFSIKEAGAARRWADRYPEGSEVTVYYDPDDPHDGILEPGASRRDWAAFYVGVGLIVLGVLITTVVIAKYALGHALPAKRELGPVGTFIFGAVLALVGYLLAFHGAKVGMGRGEPSKDWPTTVGTVTHSGVKSVRPGAARGGTKYRPDVEYEYSVGGETYIGNRLNFSGAAGGRGPANEKADAYPEGSRVIVHYNPNSPSDSVLEPGATGSSVALLCIGLGMMLLGAWFALRDPARRLVSKWTAARGRPAGG